MKVDISLGELVDKVTILSIKLKKVQSAEKLVNIQKEYDILHKCMIRAEISESSDEYGELTKINQKLWDIEDEIRRKEAAKQFDDAFVALARSVYLTNDERAAVKRRINIRYGSELIEEKEYVSY